MAKSAVIFRWDGSMKGYARELFRLCGEAAWRGGRTGPEVVPGGTRWNWNSAESFRIFDHTAPTTAPQRYYNSYTHHRHDTPNTHNPGRSDVRENHRSSQTDGG